MRTRRSSFWAASSVGIVDEFLRAVGGVETREALRALMYGVTRELGFRHFALITHTDLRRPAPGLIDIREYPQAIADRIIHKELFRRDPIMRACLYADAAFVWSEIDDIIRLDKRDHESIEFGRNLGLSEGITVPAFKLGHFLGSSTFAGRISHSRARRVLGIAQIVGTFAFQRARWLVGDLRAPVPPLRLNPRPRDCIVLAGKGLTNKEIARALAISPRTVDGYLADARKRLGVDDRAALVTAALLAGEVGLDELR